MQIMLQMSARSIFSVFFNKKIKRLARAKNDVVFILFFFACNSTPTAARRHSIGPGFHTTCVKLNFFKRENHTNTQQTQHTTNATHTRRWCLRPIYSINTPLMLEIKHSFERYCLSVSKYQLFKRI